MSVPTLARCDYCAVAASHVYDTEALCRVHQREHGTRHVHTPAETRRARRRATRQHQGAPTSQRGAP
ncbi:hypothetical protein [Frankia sp. AgB32]|uniref:hypothetical protein n=1 Tax=Frankia sp. AgB32 TaxID=631119 RepID=UPI00200C195D|nr:hypothetical protein [Frankia sp. AgB32]MCK9898377.1 hypothetical protein [Frankia sp. AgB32]